MVAKIIILFVFLPFLELSYATTSDAFDCSQATHKQVEHLIGQMALLGTDRQLPERKEDASKFCSDHSSMLQRVQSYSTKCLTSDPVYQRKLANILNDIDHAIGFLCKKLGNKRSNRYLAIGNCVNSASKYMTGCTADYRRVVQEIAKIEDVEERQEQRCCAYNSLFSCVQQHGEYSKQCTAGNVKTFVGLIQTMVESEYDKNCEEYMLGNRKCDEVTLVDGCAGDDCDAERLARPVILQLANL